MDSREETMLRILCVLLERMGGSIELTDKEIAESDERTVIAVRDDARMVLVVNLIPEYVKVGAEPPKVAPEEAEPLVKALHDEQIARWLKEAYKREPIEYTVGFDPIKGTVVTNPVLPVGTVINATISYDNS